MTLRGLIEAGPELKRFIDRLIMAAEADPCFATCESCGNPFFLDTDDLVSTCELGGCWFAATGREQDRPAWCEPRAAILRALEEEP